jgi:hypothetical protein
VVSWAIAIDFGAAVLDPGGGLPSGVTPANWLAQLQQPADSVHAATPPAGLEDYHVDLVAGDDLMDALIQAVAALNSGNTDQAHTIIADASKAFRQAVNGLDDTHPDVMRQEDACDASGDLHCWTAIGCWPDWQRAYDGARMSARAARRSAPAATPGRTPRFLRLSHTASRPRAGNQMIGT